MQPVTRQKVRQAWKLLNVKSSRELYHSFSREDNKLMRANAWDADDPTLIVNQLKAIVDSIDLKELPETDQFWLDEILWLWYHHAITCDAIGKWCDRLLAQRYADKARQHQHSDHENQITKLLWYLVYDRVDEAKRYAIYIADSTEKKLAAEMIDRYERDEFFDKSKRRAS